MRPHREYEVALAAAGQVTVPAVPEERVNVIEETAPGFAAPAATLKVPDSEVEAQPPVPGIEPVTEQARDIASAPLKVISRTQMLFATPDETPPLMAYEVPFTFKVPLKVPHVVDPETGFDRNTNRTTAAVGDRDTKSTSR